ncbi:MAG: peptidase MA family metallohydrolase [Thermincola sp.]|nr:peptidase MA family metallohydrolase [Thermincola sp.]MDT3702002.1 peptidase MA family metallohydrolase [Thermincola sp.]
MGSLVFASVDHGFLLSKIGKIAVILALLCMAFFIKEPVMAKSYLYKIIREASRVQMMWQTRGWQEIRGNHFIIKYTPRDNNVAGLVLEIAENSYEPVSRKFGYAPTKQTIIVVYPTKESLNRSFGWDADESAMGVYWAGVIRVLSPNDWIEGEDPEAQARIFADEGPVVHEFTHLVVDYASGGNYTRWLTEGIAQYEEGKLTGYEMDRPVITAADQMYPLDRMDREFDNLPNQNMAYYESLQAVNYLVHHYGEKAIYDLLAQLGSGLTMDESFKNVFGISLVQFETNFKEWTVENH